MRFLGAIGAAIVLAVGALAGGAPAGSLTLLAVRANPHQPTRTLLRVDARTLAPVGRGVELEPTIGPYALSPDRTTLAVGSGRALILVDVVKMTKTRIANVVARGPLNVVTWPSENRLLMRAGQRVLAVDPSARRVIRSATVRGAYGLGSPTSDGIAYLASPAKGIGNARVVTVDMGGRVRSVTLKRIRAGATWKRVSGVPVGAMRQPGFTVDRAHGVGYAVDPSGLVAVVNLATGETTYHTTVRSERSLMRANKEISGPMRAAQWLGNGRIGVTGFDANGRTSRAAGVAVLDTRSWRVQMLDPDSAGFAFDNDAVVTWSGKGISTFATDGSLRFSLDVEDGLAYAQAFNGLAYVWSNKRVTIVDLSSGAVLQSMQRPALYLLPLN